MLVIYYNEYDKAQTRMYTWYLWDVPTEFSIKSAATVHYVNRVLIHTEQ